MTGGTGNDQIIADGPIELWWIDGAGTLVNYATISTGQTVVQPTYDTHNWVLRDGDGINLRLIEAAWRHGR